MKPPGGDNKPKMSDKLGSNEHAAQSNLASGQGANNGSSNSSMQAGGSTGPSKAQKIGNKASELSETAKDLKDIAKAGPTGLESAGKEIKEGAEKGGAKGAAAAAGREAAGQAVGVAATALTAGALAEVQGKIAKAVSKGLKKENLKKIAIGIIAILAVPGIIAFVIIFTILYAIQNPFEFMSKVVTDPKIREFGVQAASSIGKTIIGSEATYKKYGYIENKYGTAIAAPSNTAPKPGSIEEKILKIDLKNAQYQTGAAPDCPVKLKTKELIGPTGQKTNVVDKFYDKSGNEVSNNDFMASFCFIESMPLYNMLVRTESARNTNKFSNVVLNYADNKNSKNLKSLSKTDIQNYVYSKTYDRITSKDGQTPKTKITDVNEYIDRVRLALKNNEDPNKVSYQFTSTDPGNNPEAIAKTLCTFVQGYLTSENIQKGIYTRLYSGSRSGMKTNTMASTRKLGFVTNEETEATYKQSENFTSSIAYSQNVYGSQGGTKIDPERIGNTTYGASYSATLSILYKLKDKCQEVSGNDGFFSGLYNSFLQLFGAGTDEAAVKRDINTIYNNLRRTIVAQSNGMFTTINDFGLEQLMIGVIRMGGGSAVSGLEGGAQNFNNQSQGYRSIANQYMIKLGGHFLTNEEYNKLNLASENTRREVESKNGIAYRLFDKNNIRSLSNILAVNVPKSTDEIKSASYNLVASVMNPLKTLANLQSSFSMYAFGKSNQAFAADQTGDSYMRLNSVGLTDSDYKDTNLISNSNEVQDILEGTDSPQKQILGYFKKCTEANIPSNNLFARQYKVDIEDDQVKVQESLSGTIRRDGFPEYPAIGNDFNTLGFNNVKEYSACEIYLNPTNKVTQAEFNESRQREIYGQPINELARKYRLYLYANKIVDLMVELSNTEKTTAIYSNGLDSTVSNAVQTIGAVGDIGMSSDNVPCPPGTNDLGVVDSQYTGSLKKENGVIKIRLCQIPDIPGQGNNTSGAEVSGGAIVNSRVAGAWLALAKQAKSDGISLTSSSSFRLGDSCGGTGDGSVCARPGSSPHQLGVAIDFSGMNKLGTSTTSCTGRAKLPDNPAWKWMFDNAERWGIEQYTNEAWHWDLTGSENRCNSKE